jgi:thymidine kinase
MTTRGTLTVCAGPMFAGKTTWLIAAADQWNDAEDYAAFHSLQGGLKYPAPRPQSTLAVTERRPSTACFRPAHDTRSPENQLRTHNQCTAPARAVANPAEILLHTTSQVRAVFLDEVQFWPHQGASGLVAVVEHLLNAGVHVHAAGLDYDSEGEVFETTAALALMATNLAVFTGVCAFCAQPSTRTYRKPSLLSSPRLLVGGADVYEPACQPCWQRERNQHTR